MILDQKLADGDLIILDGGIGSEIERLGGKMHSAAWCGVANWTDPDIVSRVHESYLSAGADIITANTFATARHVLAAADLADKTKDITNKAVQLAKDARDKLASDRPVAIAGSMSNHVAFSEGTVGPARDLLPTDEEETENYKEVAEVLAEAGCDFLIMEMMLELTGSVRLIKAAQEVTDLPIWIGMSTSIGPNGKMIGWDMASEEAYRLPDDYAQEERPSLESIITRLKQFGPQVMGIMHSSFHATTPGIDVLFKHWDGPVMAYPEANGYDAIARKAMAVGPEEFTACCGEWVEKGVQIIGGCCGTTIHHIQSMVENLPKKPGVRP